MRIFMGPLALVGAFAGACTDPSGALTTTTTTTTTEAGTSTSSSGAPTTGSPGETSGTTGTTGTTGPGSSSSSSGPGDPVDCVDVSDCMVAEPQCRTATACDAGACVYSDELQGTPLAEQSLGDCTMAVCNGAGGVAIVAAEGDLPDDGKACTLDTCDGVTPTHTVMPELPCYSGPADTVGVGVCVTGLQSCDADGQPVGGCLGEVTPVAELCEPDGVDGDCDGDKNDLGDCVCGDGIVSDGEACDDGNVLDGDPCSPTCEDQTIVSVVKGVFHGCALFTDGRVKCWGGNLSGELGQGDLVNRGDMPNEMGAKLPYLNLGDGVKVIALSAGAYHTCALLDDQRAKCWGQNFRGQLGMGHTSDWGDHPDEIGNSVPYVDLGPGLMIKSIHAMAHYTCAVFTDGRVKCWGDNTAGELGLGDTARRGDNFGEMGDKLPFVDFGAGKKVLSLARSASISTVGGHTCAVIEGGGFKCWGSNEHGQLGYGNTNNRGDVPGEMGDALPFVDIGQGISAKKIVTAQYHSCAIVQDDRVKCWGWGPYLGGNEVKTRGATVGTMGDNLPYAALGQAETVTDLDMGLGHTCVRLTSGDVKCWGESLQGQLGLGDNNHRGDQPNEMGDALPIVDLGATPVARLFAGGDDTCVQLTSGAIKCWGDNNIGQLGIGTMSDMGGSKGFTLDKVATVKLFSDLW